MFAKKILIRKILLILILCHVSFPVLSLTPAEFEKNYQSVLSQYHEIIKKAERPNKPSRHLNRPHYLARRPLASKELRKLKKKKQHFDHVHKLSQELVANYLKTAKEQVNQNKLKEESTTLALAVIDEIARLKIQYKSFAIPIVHNMLIDVGIKKRGACKHWAEDLLSFLRTTERDFFYVTWGEANPKKMTEHNVAVIYPNHATFYDGLLVDPWRSSGKPFWIRVKKDKHYKWNPWDYYGIY